MLRSCFFCINGVDHINSVVQSEYSFCSFANKHAYYFKTTIVKTVKIYYEY